MALPTMSRPAPSAERRVLSPCMSPSWCSRTGANLLSRSGSGSTCSSKVDNHGCSRRCAGGCSGVWMGVAFWKVVLAAVPVRPWRFWSRGSPLLLSPWRSSGSP